MRCILPFLSLVLPSVVDACVTCDSQIGTAVRAGVFNASFFPTLLEVFAPFVVLGPLIYAISRLLLD